MLLLYKGFIQFQTTMHFMWPYLWDSHDNTYTRVSYIVSHLVNVPKVWGGAAPIAKWCGVLHNDCPRCFSTDVSGSNEESHDWLMVRRWFS